jgi:O-acetyl-ADP-ribose deacetylase (regulator of RNase III)
MKNYDQLALSECVITKTYNLQHSNEMNNLNIYFKNILHVVLPKFNLTYQNACESSLHLAIRNVLDLSLQNEIKTICFSSEVLTPSKNFPIMNTITIVTRTLRKCLEKLKNKIDKIYFCISDPDLFVKFRENLKMYFPRNFQEENFFSKFLPNIKETEYGDVILPERQMSVKSEFKLFIKEGENPEKININPKEPIENYYVNQKDDIKNFNMYK